MALEYIPEERRKQVKMLAKGATSRKVALAVRRTYVKSSIVEVLTKTIPAPLAPADVAASVSFPFRVFLCLFALCCKSTIYSSGGGFSKLYLSERIFVLYKKSNTFARGSMGFILYKPHTYNVTNLMRWRI